MRSASMRRSEIERINQCINRYIAICGSLPDSRMNMHLDLHYSRVNTERLLQFPDCDFMHDMNGIIDNMDRQNCRLTNCFSPRAGIIKTEGDPKK